MKAEPLTVRRARDWEYTGKKFYDSEDFFAQVTKGLRLRKPVIAEAWRKHTRLCEGDVIKDNWGKIGVVIWVFEEPSAEHGWCDCIAVCKQDFNPQLGFKKYWKAMIGTIQRAAWKR